MNTRISKLVVKSLVLFTPIAFLSACSMESEADRRIAAGMACLDEARTSQHADLCLQKVEGLNSSQAALIRCSANMIAQGLTGGRLANAVQELKDNSGNKTAAMMGFLVFNPSLSQHSSAKTLENCKASGVKSVTFLANMIRTASIVANPNAELSVSIPVGSCGVGSTCTRDEIQQQVSSILAANNPEVNATVGALAQNAHSTYCSGSSMTNQDVCQKLDSAIASGHGDPGTIGLALMNLLKDN